MSEHDHDERDRLFAADEATAPPRRNGELVFAAPWQSRVFGLAAALRERGLFEWDELRTFLIAEIADWERQAAPAQEWSYYACWRSALERLLARKGVCSADELEQRERQLESRPAGHDHAHGEPAQSSSSSSG